MASTDDTPPGLLSVLRLAISDPGSVTERQRYPAGFDESLAHWRARAVAEAVRPFLATPPELTGAERAHVEEARRILAGLEVPASYGRERALRDAGRTLLNMLDKLAPKETP